MSKVTWRRITSPFDADLLPLYCVAHHLRSWAMRVLRALSSDKISYMFGGLETGSLFSPTTKYQIRIKKSALKKKRK